MTKESEIYLRFIKENLTLILLPGILFGSLAGVYQFQRPAVEHLNALFQMDYREDNVLSQIQLTDQAVSFLRERNIQKGIGVDNVQSSIYKPGPLLLTIDLSGSGHQTLKESLSKFKSLAESRFPLKAQGEIVQSFEKTSEYTWAGIGFVLGSFIGLLASLIKSYFKNF